MLSASGLAVPILVSHRHDLQMTDMHKTPFLDSILFNGVRSLVT